MNGQYLNVLRVDVRLFQHVYAPVDRRQIELKLLDT